MRASIAWRAAAISAVAILGATGQAVASTGGSASKDSVTGSVGGSSHSEHHHVHRPGHTSTNPFQTCTTNTRGPDLVATKDIVAAGGGVLKLPTCPRNQISSYTLMFRARKTLQIPRPLVRTAPPRGKLELVGIPTWFWLDKSQWSERSATAHGGGLSATVTASVYKVLVDPGDGTESFTCGPPWIPYADGAESACIHKYAHSGRYTATVTAYWATAWTGSDGNGGTLPTIEQAVKFRVRVAQARSELIANP